MSIFSTILGKIFPSDHPANTTPAGSAPGAGGGSPAPAQSAGTGTSTAVSGTAASGAAQAPSASFATAQSVDVNAVLTDLQANRAEQLNWRTSIVDLLKLLGLDSSLDARKELAAELRYTGNTADSAAMNVWLHKEVMHKLAENGGKVPDELKH
jgi:hypothetical protein